MRFTLIVVFLWNVLTFGQDLYPVNKDGFWGLMKENGEMVLEPTHEFIHYSTLSDLFTFYQDGYWGVMDQQGKVIFEPEFQRIKYFSASIGKFKKDSLWYLYVDGKNALEEAYLNITQLQDDIYGLQTVEGIRYLNLKTQKFTSKVYANGSIEPSGMLLLSNSDSISDLISPVNMSILVDSIQDRNWWSMTMMHITRNDSVALYDSRNEKFLTSFYETIVQQYRKVHIGIKGKEYTLIDLKRNKTFEIPKVDEVLEVSGNLMAYKVKDKAGVYHLSRKKDVLPAKYDGIALKNGLIYTKMGQKVGLALSSGKEIFKPEYDVIEDFENIYVVGNDDKKGLASTSGKIIEPIEHKRIEVFDNKVKCYKSNELVMISIDQSGNVKERTTYEEYMTVSFTSPRRPRQSSRSLTFDGGGLNSGSDGQLKKFGWRQREVERQKGDSTVIYYGAWGLFDEEDSLRIRHQFGHVNYISDSIFQCYQRKPMKKLGDNESKQLAARQRYVMIIHPVNNDYGEKDNFAYSKGWFQIVHQPSYKKFSRHKFLALHLSDWDKHELARGFAKEMVLVDKMGKIAHKGISYLGEYHEGILRFCKEGEYKSVGPNRQEKTILTYWSLFTNAGFKIYDVDDKRPKFSVQKGKWFYTDRYGKQLNEKPFQFATDFKEGKAIVMRDGKWGVVDTAMNEVVPIVYTSVERLQVNGQNFFHVKKSATQNYLYQRNLSTYTETDIQAKHLSKYHSGKWMHKIGTKTTVLDSNLTDTGFPYQAVYGVYGDLCIVKMTNAIYQFVDANGKAHGPEFATSQVTPTKNGRFIVRKSEYNFALVDADGKYIIPKFAGNKMISSSKDMIFYQDYNQKFAIWGDKAKVNTPKKVKVLSGNIEQGILLVKKGKKKKMLYSYKNLEYINKKAMNVVSLESSGIVFENKNKEKGLLSYNGDTLLKPEYEKIIYEGRSWGRAYIDWKNFVIVDKLGKKLFADTITYFAETMNFAGRYRLTSKNRSAIIDEDANIIVPWTNSYISSELVDYLVATDSSSNFHKYYNYEGKVEHQFERWYRYGNEKGIPPNGHFHITRFMQRGKKPIYYFDNFGTYNSHMPFDFIKPLSSENFLLTEHETTGIYSHDGDTIVAPQYHLVKPVRGKFQVRFFNSFGYFELDGKSFFDPRNTK